MNDLNLIATALGLVSACRNVVSKAESVGGELLAEVEPSDIGSNALNAVLNRLDEQDFESAQSSQPVDEIHNADEDGLNLPQPLKDYVHGSAKTLPWRWLGPGVHLRPDRAECQWPECRITPHCAGNTSSYAQA